jgi:hypothetical protein
MLEQPWSPELEIITKCSKQEVLNLLAKSKEGFIWPVMSEMVVEVLDLTTANNQKYLSGQKSAETKKGMRPLRLKSSIVPPADDSNAAKMPSLASHSNNQS